MIIAHNRNTSTRNPRSDETNIFRRQSPTRIRTVKTYIVQLPSLTTVPDDQIPGIYYSGIHTLLVITPVLVVLCFLWCICPIQNRHIQVMVELWICIHVL